MKYLCTNCNYTYDKSIGDREEEIEIGAELEKCPICEEYDSFQGIEEEIHIIKGEENLDPMEIDHFPEIRIIPPRTPGSLGSGTQLEVTICQEMHPMGSEHRICAISLYDEYGDLIEDKYLKEDDESKVVFDFDDLDEFEIRLKCSLHGIWAKRFIN